MNLNALKINFCLIFRASNVADIELPFEIFTSRASSEIGKKYASFEFDDYLKTSIFELFGDCKLTA